jgi:hypothetical protein
MKYGLKVDLPALAGAKRMVEVPGLGAVINPGIYEVPEELLPLFEATHGYPLSAANFQEGVDLIELPGSYRGDIDFDKPEVDQVEQDDPRAPKSGASAKEKTKEEADADFEREKADNDKREAEKHGPPDDKGNPGGNPTKKKVGDN